MIIALLSLSKTSSEVGQVHSHEPTSLDPTPGKDTSKGEIGSVFAGGGSLSLFRNTRIQIIRAARRFLAGTSLFTRGRSDLTHILGDSGDSASFMGWRASLLHVGWLSKEGTNRPDRQWIGWLLSLEWLTRSSPEDNYRSGVVQRTALGTCKWLKHPPDTNCLSLAVSRRWKGLLLLCP
jgi:hypothetical protein